jgi:superoxide dismutase
VNGRISNRWITLHNIQEVEGFIPVLVMDVWDHALILDYKPAEREKYITAFFSNIDWSAVESRVTNPSQASELKLARIPMEPMKAVFTAAGS